jgi:hypothetical protein
MAASATEKVICNVGASIPRGLLNASARRDTKSTETATNDKTSSE